MSNPKYNINITNSNVGVIGENNATEPRFDQREFKEADKAEEVPFRKVESDSKYNDRLVTFNIRFLNFYPNEQTQKLSIFLDISFGEVEEKVIYSNNFGLDKKEGHLKFGIKFGRFCLELTNLCLPLNKREVPKIEEFNGDVTCIGNDENPEWQFKVKHKSEVPEKALVLFGLLKNQEIGIIELSNTSCQVKATFKVNINSNDLGITEQDGLWNEQTNKKVKETKLRAFFKNVIEPKLKNYVSKLELQYDSTTIS